MKTTTRQLLLESTGILGEIHENGWRGSSLGVFSWGEIGNTGKKILWAAFFCWKITGILNGCFWNDIRKDPSVWHLIVTKHVSSTVAPGYYIIVVDQAGFFFDLNRLIRSRKHQLREGNPPRKFTLPDTNRATKPLKIDGWNTIVFFPFGAKRPIFRCFCC